MKIYYPLIVNIFFLFGCNNVQQTSRYQIETPITTNKTTALEQFENAFQGSYSVDEIKTRLETAMELYKVPITEEYYKRVGDILISLRKKNGIEEMEILSNMIYSHDPTDKRTFAVAASASSNMLAALGT